MKLDRCTNHLGMSGARRCRGRVWLSRRGELADLRCHARIIPSITCWCGTSRARRTWQTAMPAPRGKVGVAMATSGPGATNLVTGIATAMMDSSPMVCITGQVAAHLIGDDAFQEMDVTGITLPITKHNYLVTNVRRDRRSGARGILYRPQRSTRPGADRHFQGCPDRTDRVRFIQTTVHPVARLPPPPHAPRSAAASRQSR